jgi:hypothetical protein
VSLTSQLRDGALASWCTEWFSGSADVAGTISAAARRARPVFPAGQVDRDHWAAIGGAFGARLGALTQPAPPYYALYGLVHAELARREWADAQAARYPTHARLSAFQREMALDMRPTSVGWLAVEAGSLSEPDPYGSDAERIAAEFLRPDEVRVRHYPAEPVLADLFERTRDYQARYAPPGHLGTPGAESGLARIFWLFNMFEEVYRSGVIGEALHRLFAPDAPSVATMRAAAGDAVVSELVALARRLIESGSLDALRGLAGNPDAGRPLGIAGPVFVNHWADGDLVIIGPTGSTLIDVKTVAKTSDLDRCVRWLWQLIAYAWLDAADRYRIRRVGLYLARHGVLLTWQRDELAHALLAGRDPHEAHAEFYAEARRVLADEGATATIADLPATPLSDPPASFPRPGGLYMSPDHDYTSYLRFTDDARVVATSSTGNPEQVARWLKPGPGNHSQGTYRLDRGEISFTTTSESGRISYRGLISHDASQLILTVHSQINGHRSREIYSFMPTDV